MSSLVLPVGVAAVAVLGAAAFFVWHRRSPKRAYVQYEWPGWQKAVKDGAKCVSGFLPSPTGNIQLFFQEYRPPPSVRPKAAVIFAVSGSRNLVRAPCFSRAC